jgi:SAM-dependent methyltransferase
VTCCSPVVTATAAHFDEGRVREELEAYRRGGPGPTAQGLLSQLIPLGASGRTVLDIGSGFGAMSLGLLAAGADRAICVDLSPAALAASAEEAARQGVGDRIERVQADFVTVADSLPVSDVVVLDRVVCCYPDYLPLLERAAARSGGQLALSYPRDRWWVRLTFRIENAWRKIRGDDFRAFVHGAAAIAAALEGQGLTRRRSLSTFVWQMEVYTRPLSPGFPGG